MATYYSRIPSGVSAKHVFDVVNAEVISAMDGISVFAHGDERMGEYFSVVEDEVFKACTDTMEIVQKIHDGATIGRLHVIGEDWKVTISPWIPSREVDDCTIPIRDFYRVSVTLIAHSSFGNSAATQQAYDRWLDPLQSLESPSMRPPISLSYGESKDVWMGYCIRASQVPAFIRKIGLGERSAVLAYGEVQEQERIQQFSIDLARYGFQGLYAVYSGWPVRSFTNYPSEASNRFCTLVDAKNTGLLVSVGRRHCAFRCVDGRLTRNLAGNRFDIYQTKTRRTLTVSFEQYADEDPPVRTFSGGVRAGLARLGIKI